MHHCAKLQGSELDQQLLKKYANRCLPRYTSYPTAPNFRTALVAKQQKDWLSSIRANEPVSVYAHIPFCRSMCWYCGCHTKVTKQDKPIISYFDTLKKEAALVTQTIGFKPRLNHVHFGGGTPTILSPDQFQELAAYLKEHFHFENDAEIAIEIDPRTLTASMIDALAKSGVTRASLGVQSFDPAVQKAINRTQSEELVSDAVLGLRSVGIMAVNFDLIYGLPQQTSASCVDTVKRSVNLHPDRISVFGYAHVPSFKKHQKMIPDAQLPNDLERIAQADVIADTLVKEGYIQIGLDHFALPDDPLSKAADGGRLHRNFQGYTTDACKTLIGLGASSISRFHEGYIQNEVSIHAYQQCVEENLLTAAKGYKLAGEDRMRGIIIERLMCDFSVDLIGVCEEFGKNYRKLLRNNPRLDELRKDGIVQISDGLLTINTDQRFVVRAVAAAFDSHLGSVERKFSKVA